MMAIRSKFQDLNIRIVTKAETQGQSQDNDNRELMLSPRTLGQHLLNPSCQWTWNWAWGEPTGEEYALRAQESSSD